MRGSLATDLPRCMFLHARLHGKTNCWRPLASRNCCPHCDSCFGHARRFRCGVRTCRASHWQRRLRAAGALANPANDARDKAASTARWIDVLRGSTPSRVEITEAFGQYTERARGAELALFFYAGHGAQLNGENYLLPVDAAVENEADLKLKAIDLSSLQDALPEAHANVIILDAFATIVAGTIAGHRGIGASRGLSPMDQRLDRRSCLRRSPTAWRRTGAAGTRRLQPRSLGISAREASKSVK